MMNIPFWKMQGAGNDFIILDGVRNRIPPLSTGQIRAWCKPHTGIGAEGLLLLLPASVPGCHHRMQFFNPDGKEADMCGNGARCLARFAVDQALAPPELTLQTASGPVQAMVRDDAVTILLPPPRNINLNIQLKINNAPVCVAFADTGVPHAIVRCNDISSAPLDSLAPAIRHHPYFAPAGTNVDFIEIAPDRTVHIRTFERGVEGETLACGTGIAAAGLVCILCGEVSSPVQVRAAGGDTLLVSVTLEQDTVRELALSGPAAHVFQGVIPLIDTPDKKGTLC